MHNTNIPTDAGQIKTDYLFVYGTLRKACKSGAHNEYLGGADFVSSAKIRGQLYRVGDYPGLVLSDAGHWVIGEIYLLRSESQLHDLDVYEGCAKTSPQPYEYNRSIHEVVLNNGDLVKAWVYVYQQDTQALMNIGSGDFLSL